MRAVDMGTFSDGDTGRHQLNVLILVSLEHLLKKPNIVFSFRLVLAILIQSEFEKYVRIHVNARSCVLAHSAYFVPIQEILLHLRRKTAAAQ